MDDVIKEMEKYAEEKGIPIMQKRGMNFLCKFIEKNNIKSIGKENCEKIISRFFFLLDK